MSLQPQEGIRKPLPTYLGYQAKQTSGPARNQQDPWEKKEPLKLIIHPESCDPKKLLHANTQVPITPLPEERGNHRISPAGIDLEMLALPVASCREEQTGRFVSNTEAKLCYGLDVWSFGSFLCVTVPGFELSSQNKVSGLEASVLSVED